MNNQLQQKPAQVKEEIKKVIIGKDEVIDALIGAGFTSVETNVREGWAAVKLVK